MKLVVIFLLASVYAETKCCSVAEVSTLLKGCDYLKGLRVTSSEGTTIDDNNCGLLVSEVDFPVEPSMQYPLAESTKFYTFILLDPDVPLHVGGEFAAHIIKTNIPGSALTAPNGTLEGDDYLPYVPPAPIPASGPHRYICILYEQGNANFRPADVPVLRVKFRLADWLADKDLYGPVAATQFLKQIVGNPNGLF